MQIFNADETGVTVVHIPGKVVAQLGRQNVYSVTSAERGKTHTILAYVSASGFVLPPLIIYPWKKNVPEHLKEGAVPNTLFRNSKSGWITKELYTLNGLISFCATSHQQDRFSLSRMVIAPMSQSS